MYPSPRAGRVRLAFIAAIGLAALAVGTAAAHEERTVAGYDMEVGFINEPVFVGDKSGLEFFVHKGDTPVEGLETTVKAQVIYQGQSRDLPISAREDDPGAYESQFIPTAAGPYTFHLTGTIEGTAIDETFTSSPTGFDEVKDQASGQFPVQFPSQADIVADAQAGRNAANQVTIALVLGAAGLLFGLIGTGLAICRAAVALIVVSIRRGVLLALWAAVATGSILGPPRGGGRGPLAARRQRPGGGRRGRLATGGHPADLLGADRSGPHIARPARRRRGGHRVRARLGRSGRRSHAPRTAARPGDGDLHGQLAGVVGGRRPQHVRNLQLRRRRRQPAAAVGGCRIGRIAPRRPRRRDGPPGDGIADRRRSRPDGRRGPAGHRLARPAPNGFTAGWLAPRHSDCSSRPCGAVGMLLLGGPASGIDVAAFVGTHSGTLVLTRLAITALACVVVWWLATRRSRAALVVAGAAAVAGLVLVALGGHAAAFSSAAPVAATVVHLVAASIWVAGLATLGWLAILPEHAPAEFATLVPRFSGVAIVSIGLVSATGIYADWLQTGSLLSLETPYQATLAVKIGLTVAALAIGWLNYRAAGRDRRFGPRVFLEGALALGVIVATGILASGSPPGQAAPIPIASVASSALDAGSAELGIAPGRPGPTQFTVKLPTAPVADATVELDLSRLDQAGETRLPLRPEADRLTWIAPGGLLPANSQFDANVIVRNGAGVEQSRTRFTFALDDETIIAGRAEPPLDPVAIVVAALIGAALVGGLLLVAGRTLPATDRRAGRVALLGGSVVSLVLGIVVLAGGLHP